MSPRNEAVPVGPDSVSDSKQDVVQRHAEPVVVKKAVVPAGLGTEHGGCDDDCITATVG